MIVVNFSTDKYRIGQKRLENSLYKAGHLNYAMYGEYKQIHSPTHKESPYEFKVHAMIEASKIDPVVLWADSSMFLVGDIKRIEDCVLNDGHYMEEAGHYVRDWCNVHTLQYFHLMKTVPYTMFIAGLFAIDFRTERGQAFMTEWMASAKAGCFKGDWSNHRHDMTCGSIIASQLGMHYQDGGSHIAYIGEGFGKPKDDICFFAQGLV